MTTYLVLIVGLILINGLLSAIRSALANSRRTRLNELADADVAGVQAIIMRVDQPIRWRLTLRLARTIVRFLILTLALLAFEPLITAAFEAGALDPLADFVIVALLLLGGVVLVLVAELIPEALISRNPEDWALRLQPFITTLHTLLSPFIVPLLWVSERFELPLDGYAPLEFTPESLITMIENTENDDGMEAEERKLLVSVLGFADTLAREIMIPRIDVLALEVNLPILETLDRVVKANYSRIPIYEDTIDNIQGVLLVKDLLDVWHSGETDRELRSIIRQPYFVPETKRLGELLAEMQQQRIHIALVVDEFGGLAGIVTLEDFVEEIIGEVQDEYDDDEESPYTLQDDGSYLVLAGIDIDDLNTLIGSRLDSEGVETLGGLIYEKLGRVPVVGEKMQLDDVPIEVRAVSGRRIRWVRVEPPNPNRHRGYEEYDKDDEHAK